MTRVLLVHHTKRNKIRPKVGLTYCVRFQGDFRFHRTSADGDQLWMYRLFRDEERGPVDAPHTYAGAGGLVTRGDSDLLAVKERGLPFWKLPGGYVNPGERMTWLQHTVRLDWTVLTWTYTKTTGYLLYCTEKYWIVYMFLRGRLSMLSICMNQCFFSVQRTKYQVAHCIPL